MDNTKMAKMMLKGGEIDKIIQREFNDQLLLAIRTSDLRKREREMKKIIKFALDLSDISSIFFSMNKSVISFKNEKILFFVLNFTSSRDFARFKNRLNTILNIYD